MNDDSPPLLVGAVNYLNSKPLIHGFERRAAGWPSPGVRLACDLPSRLADSLAEGRYDIALIPTFEALRNSDYRIVPDACVAADGPVASVKLYFRTQPERVETLALDEGSRTSAALGRLLLLQRHERSPELVPLPIGAGLADADADAVLVIGDRAMHDPPPSVASRLVGQWDLAEEWRRDTGLPFVFACWTARHGVDPRAVAPLLAACRDDGVECFADIARSEAPRLGLSVEHAERYLRENLRFRLGERELQGMDRFRQACEQAGLLPASPPATPSPLATP